MDHTLCRRTTVRLQLQSIVSMVAPQLHNVWLQLQSIVSMVAPQLHNGLINTGVVTLTYTSNIHK